MRFSITDRLKKKINVFIKDNGLRISVVDNGMSPYSLALQDGKTVLYPVQHENSCFLMSYDKNLVDDDMGPYTWSKSLTEHQLLLEIKDVSGKTGPQGSVLVMDISGFVCDMTVYDDNWYAKVGVSDRWLPVKEGEVTNLVLDDSSVQPELVSPYDSLHMVSPINNGQVVHRPGKLYVEIEPINCDTGTYLARMLMNPDPMMPEYIKWFVPDEESLTLLTREIENTFLDK
jgi:hypothetical protein